MDSRSVFLFLLSTVTAFLLLVLALSAGGVVLLLPPVLDLPKSITQIPYGLMTSMKSTLIYGNRMQLMPQVREL